MRLAVFALLAGSAARAVTVCPDGPGRDPCATPRDIRVQIQTAIDKAAPGDVIEIPPGDYFVDSTIILKKKEGADWITIRTTREQDLPAPGYRAREEHSALMPRIAAAGGFVLFDVQKDYTLREAPGDGPFSLTTNGNTLVIGADCSADNPCRARSRNGTALTFTGPVGTVTLTPPLPSGASMRIGLNNEGKLTIKKKADLVSGKHFTCTNCATPEDFLIPNYSSEYSSDAISIVAAGYGTGGWGTPWSQRSWLVGPCVVDKNCHGVFPAEPSSIYTGPAGGPHHYRFIGIHMLAVSFQYCLLSLGSALGVTDWRDMPHDIEIDRCLFSGRRNVRGPGTGIQILAENISIRNSSFFWFTRHDADGQQILVHSACPGPVHIENNSLDGAVENFMAGGTGAAIAGYSPSITFLRNYVWKRLDYWVNVYSARRAPNVIGFGSAGDAACNVAKDMDACFYHVNDIRYTLTADSYVTINNPVSGVLFTYIDSAGAYVVTHPWSSADVTCSGQLVCVAGAGSVPPEGNLQYGWAVKEGTLEPWAGMRKPIQKNLWECKNCRNTLIEGNVFHRVWLDQQASAFTLTPRAQYANETWARLDDVTIQRNLLLGASNLMGVLGTDESGGNAWSRDVKVLHNLFFDIDRARWAYTLNGFGGGIMFAGGGVDFLFHHNTVQLSGSQGHCENPGNRVNYQNNLFVWKGESDFASRGTARGFLNAVAAGLASKDSVYSHNVNLIGSSPTIGPYPKDNWSDKGDSARHFLALSDPPSFQDDFRLSPSGKWSASCTSGCGGPAARDGSGLTTDGVDPGADVDWVETLTDGVREGLPRLADRWELEVEPQTRGVLFRYSPPPSAACTLRIATHQSVRPALLAADTDTAWKQADTREGNTREEARRTFRAGSVAPLDPGTTYWYVLSCDGKLIKDLVATLPGGAE